MTLRGVKSCRLVPEGPKISDNGYVVKITDEKEILKIRDEVYKRFGFKVDYDNDMFIGEKGAFLLNIKKSDFTTLKEHYYTKFYIDEGYELVTGDPAPENVNGYYSAPSNSIGVYVSNYMDLLDKTKEK